MLEQEVESATQQCWMRYLFSAFLLIKQSAPAPNSDGSLREKKHAAYDMQKRKMALTAQGGRRGIVEGINLS